MRIGSSLFLIAIGAILRWAVTASTKGVNLQTVGLILLIIGGIGLIVSLFWMTVVAERMRPADVMDPRDRAIRSPDL